MTPVTEEDFRVGDVISMRGPSVPTTLEGCYWRVKAVPTDGHVTAELDGPYLDGACTQRRLLTMAEYLHTARR